MYVRSDVVSFHEADVLRNARHLGTWLSLQTNGFQVHVSVDTSATSAVKMQTDHPNALVSMHS